jgi:hypothetical protein
MPATPSPATHVDGLHKPNGSRLHSLPIPLNRFWFTAIGNIQNQHRFWPDTSDKSSTKAEMAGKTACFVKKPQHLP